MSAALTLMAEERGTVTFVQQVLFYPVADAAFNTDSYYQLADGYFLSRTGTQWFWDQYTTDADERARITTSPLRATPDQLRGLPPALVITDEADVLRDEGEACAAKLRQADVATVSTRYQGVIHDFVMLDSLHDMRPHTPQWPRRWGSCEPSCTTHRAPTDERCATLTVREAGATSDVCLPRV